MTFHKKKEEKKLRPTFHSLSTRLAERWFYYLRLVLRNGAVAPRSDFHMSESLKVKQGCRPRDATELSDKTAAPGASTQGELWGRQPASNVTIISLLHTSVMGALMHKCTATSGFFTFLCMCVCVEKDTGRSEWNADTQPWISSPSLHIKALEDRNVPVCVGPWCEAESWLSLSATRRVTDG